MPYQALATGPVSFLDSNSNQQEIPLSAIYFDSNGPNASGWLSLGGNSANTTLVKALLAQLAAQNLLTPGAQTTPAPVAYDHRGGSRRDRQRHPGDDFKRRGLGRHDDDECSRRAEVYPGLTTETIANALGTSAATANGLVYLESNNNQPPAEFTGRPLGRLRR